MKKVSNIGYATMILGLIGMSGAIDTNYGWKLSLSIFAIGLLMAFSGTIGLFWKELNEDYKDYKDYRSIQHSCNNDASYPSFLRK